MNPIQKVCKQMASGEYEERLKVIKSIVDAHDFYMWIKELKIDGYQGWDFEHTETGHIKFLNNQDVKYLDVQFLYDNRAEANDYIRRVLGEYKEYVS